MLWQRNLMSANGLVVDYTCSQVPNSDSLSLAEIGCRKWVLTFVNWYLTRDNRYLNAGRSMLMKLRNEALFSIQQIVEKVAVGTRYQTTDNPWLNRHWTTTSCRPMQFNGCCHRYKTANNAPNSNVLHVRCSRIKLCLSVIDSSLCCYEYS